MDVETLSARDVAKLRLQRYSGTTDNPTTSQDMEIGCQNEGEEKKEAPSVDNVRKNEGYPTSVGKYSNR
jgi:hypothetical protein